MGEGAVGENDRVGGRAVFMGVTGEGSPEEVTWWLRAEEKQGARGPRARKRASQEERPA